MITRLLIVLSLLFFPVTLMTSSTVLAVEASELGSSSSQLAEVAVGQQETSAESEPPGDWLANANKTLSYANDVEDGGSGFLGTGPTGSTAAFSTGPGTGPGTTTVSPFPPSEEPEPNDGGSGETEEDPEDQGDIVAEVNTDLIEEYLEENDIELDTSMEEIEDKIDEIVDAAFEQLEDPDLDADALQEIMDEVEESLSEYFDKIELADEMAEYIEDRIEHSVAAEMLEQLEEEDGWTVDIVDDESGRPGTWGEDIWFIDEDGDTYHYEPGENLDVDHP